VPYRGASLALQGLLAGDVQLYLAGAGVGEAQVGQGQLKALAVASARRLDVLPNTPTFAEVGIGDIQASNWWGVVVPAATPQAIVSRLHDGLCDALGDPVVKATMDHLGNVSVCNAPDEMKQQLITETGYWQKVVKELGVAVE